MAHVPLQCPECHSRRGRCRCGAYLIHHAYTPKYVVDEDQGRTWLLVDDGARWVSLADWLRENGA